MSIRGTNKEDAAADAAAAGMASRQTTTRLLRVDLLRSMFDSVDSVSVVCFQHRHVATLLVRKLCVFLKS